MAASWLVALLVAASLMSACSNRDTTAPSAALVVSLSSPNNEDGALLLILRGPDLGGVQWVTPHGVVYTRSPSANEARVIMIGDIAPGDLLRVGLTGSHPISDYSATVSQVATRTDSLRATGGYVLSLREDRGP